MEAIESEVKKLIDLILSGKNNILIGWPIVPIPKKNEKIRIYIDYRDLNVACPKDEYPLPITDVMIDNTSGFQRMFFMDDFLRDNQIKMYPKDERYTPFRMSLGVYCYIIMPFGLKNAGAT